MEIAILSASTRIDRKSHRVALALQNALKQHTQHQVALLDLASYQFPVMEEVLHRHPNPPDGLEEFAAAVRAADAVVFVSPEYNGGFTSALKNAVDYLKESEFSGKVIGVCSVSTGAMGGIRGALAMQQLVLGVGGYPIPQMLLVGQVHERFAEDGAIIDPAFEPKIDTFLKKFLFLAEAVADKRMATV